MTEQDIHPAIRGVLRTIGLLNPDLTDPLHAGLVQALHDLGPYATPGKRLTAMRWVFAWELRAAGEQFAKAKTAYEHNVDRRTVQLRGGEEKMSRAEAEQLARAEDEANELHLVYLLAEQRERAMRNFLSTIQSAQDDARTDRADARAASGAHAQGMDGGA
ncbi:hypothetical protein SCB71_14610 [Herbiconiux sp. KACC 21604]|uniref:hypothetical protein n=1 Tax=unclassified Herbiconiux TaxID=2618217 RepID=UPI001492AF7C|nr:hypothetical protein [Herbiconiux sp. SALV-R1]QJU54374.1 hypothetical protein HL652_12550 [Herbiconiux sp. SALV-R1]WPO85445.1 hypothetical protein SCB71_14610 [Herbiconiux sp. KACC 21604]